MGKAGDVGADSRLRLPLGEPRTLAATSSASSTRSSSGPTPPGSPAASASSAASSTCPSPAPSQAEADEWWSIYRLESKFELLAGGLPGEALGCYGDSGGPLLRGKRARDLTTYGVNFAVEGTLSTACGHGGAYLVFNRKMLDFVRDAL